MNVSSKMKLDQMSCQSTSVYHDDDSNGDIHHTHDNHHQDDHSNGDTEDYSNGGTEEFNASFGPNGHSSRRLCGFQGLWVSPDSQNENQNSCDNKKSCKSNESSDSKNVAGEKIEKQPKINSEGDVSKFKSNAGESSEQIKKLPREKLQGRPSKFCDLETKASRPEGLMMAYHTGGCANG